MKSRSPTIFKASLFLLLVGFCGFLLKRQLYDPWFPVTNPKSYNRIVSDFFKNRQNVSEFLPASIPKQAEESAFFHLSGALQASYTIALRLRLPAVEFQRLKDDLERSGRQMVQRSQINMSPLIYPKTLLERKMQNGPYADLSFTDLPKDFTVFLFNSRLEDLAKNHHEFAFTAISPKRSEVVYYYSGG